MTQEQIDQIRADFERDLPLATGVIWSKQNSCYESNYKNDRDTEIIAGEYNNALRAYRKAHARYAGGGEADNEKP